MRNTIPGVLLTLMLLVAPVSSVRANQAYENNTWYSVSDSDTVIIFVHGIFSDSKECWTKSNGVFWPEIVKNDPRFNNPSIFLGGYYTDFSSGIYSIPDAADELITNLRAKDVNGNAAPLKNLNIIFVAHSTGGIVVRYLIESNQELFKVKAIGLFLLASPSNGSAWANRLKWLNVWYKNKMAAQLERDNVLIVNLDRRFSDLVGHRKLPGLTGIDAFENKFILPGYFWNSELIVREADSKSYFGAGRIVPGTDHFSIAKPASASDYSHVLLWDFYEHTFNPIADRLRAKIQTSNPSRTAYSELTNRLIQVASFDLIAKMRKYVQNKEMDNNKRMIYYQDLMRNAKTREEKDRIWNMQTSELITGPSLNSEYSAKFKVEAILLRNELLKRLPAIPPNPREFSDYEYPTNPIGLNMLIDNLEMLAKQLPK